MRQPLIREYDPKRGVSIATLAHEYSPDFQVPEHAHGSDQLIFATSGVMEVWAGSQFWLIPPHFALWVPARTIHSIRMRGTVSMRTLYVRHGLAARMPSACTVFHVAPLLRELIVKAVEIKALRVRKRLHCSLCDLLFAELQAASPLSMTVVLPDDSRGRAIANAVIANPGGRRSMSELCASAGASVRTIQRLFRREVGSDFESWRRQIRLMKAVELLVSGHSVKAASYALGYSHSTAFVAMFRAALGVTPRAWIKAAQSSPAPTSPLRNSKNNLRPNLQRTRL